MLRSQPPTSNLQCPISSFHYGIIAREIEVGGKKHGESSKAEVAA